MPQNELPGTSADDQSADVPSSQRRVTPQELTLALTLLKVRGAEAERRREEEARSLAETVPLGPLVERTGLAATPEQIWAEVQALRARAGHSSARGTGQDAEPSGFAYRLLPTHHGDAAPASGRRGTLGSILLGSVALAVVLTALNSLSPAGKPIRQPRPPGFASWSRGFPPEPSGLVPASPRPPFFQPAPRRVQPNRPFIVTAPDAEFYRRLNLSQGPHPQYRLESHGWEVEALSGQAVYALSAVPDGCTFYSPPFSGMGFRGGGPMGPTCVFEGAGLAMNAAVWAMTRYDGRYYQHVWIRPADIGRLNRGGRLELYPAASGVGPGGAVPLTLAVGSHPTNCAPLSARQTGPARNTFQPCSQDGPNGPVMEVPAGKKVVLDGHAWEDFTSLPQRRYAPSVWEKEPGLFSPDRNSYEAPDFDANSQVRPLGAVHDGVPIHCGNSVVSQLLHLSAPAGAWPHVLIDARPNLDRAWTVIKLGGHLYLRGWVSARPARTLPPSRGLAIFSGPGATEFVNPAVPVTLPLNGVIGERIEGGALPSPEAEDVIGKAVVANVHLDGHAWDKW